MLTPKNILHIAFVVCINVTITATNGNLPRLQEAIRNNNIDYVVRYVQHHPDTPNPILDTERTGNTLLHQIVDRKMEDMLSRVLGEWRSLRTWRQPTRGKGTFPLNEKNRNGDTPLHIAVMKRSHDIVETLLQHGANPNAYNQSGFTPLHLAVLNTAPHIVSTLAQADDTRIDKKSKPAMASIGEGVSDTDLVRNVILAEGEKKTPLQLAVDLFIEHKVKSTQHPLSRIIATLLEHGASLEKIHIDEDQVTDEMLDVLNQLLPQREMVKEELEDLYNYIAALTRAIQLPT